jgi:septal ring-binding cell division protein DamX
MQQNCSASVVSSNIALSNAYVATPNAGNYSSILKSCCHGAPVAEYSYDPCMIYCNVTAPASTQELTDCLVANAGDMDLAIMQNQNATHSTPSPTESTKSATQAPTATGKPAEGDAVRRKGLSKAVWMVFGLGVIGAFGELL